MDIQQLLTIYPQATVQTAPPSDQQTFYIALGDGKYLCLAPGTFSDRERALLTLLKPAPTPTVTDHWSAFLLGTSLHAPQTQAHQFQLIHFRVRFTDATPNHSQWLTALGDLFEDRVHAAFTTNNQGYFLLTTPVSLRTQPDLAALLTLLDDDFSTNTRIFLGSRQSTVADLPTAYQFEQQLFAQNQQTTVMTLSSGLMLYLAAQHRQTLSGLATKTLMAPDNRALITALYQTQGNVKQAAERLFLHRNTLLYRIEKFERASGLDLKNMDDLVCSYLLTLTANQ